MKLLNELLLTVAFTIPPICLLAFLLRRRSKMRMAEALSKKAKENRIGPVHGADPAEKAQQVKSMDGAVKLLLSTVKK